MSGIRALIVDDEPLARRGIRVLLSREPDFEVVGEAASAPEAARALVRHAPDVVFLDIQLPGGTGLELASRMPRRASPLIVFVTAYQEHAVRAFELHAVDYLLKPLDQDRFAETVQRVRATVAAGAADSVRARLAALVAELRSLTDSTLVPPAGEQFAERLPVRIGERVVIVPVAEIEWIEADGDYVRLHVGGRSTSTRTTMGQLERRLDPAHFRRVHRSAIVNLDGVRAVELDPRGRHVLLLRDGTRVRVSRSLRTAVLAALGYDEGNSAPD